VKQAGVLSKEQLEAYSHLLLRKYSSLKRRPTKRSAASKLTTSLSVVTYVENLRADTFWGTGKASEPSGKEDWVERWAEFWPEDLKELGMPEKKCGRDLGKWKTFQDRYIKDKKKMYDLLEEAGLYDGPLSTAKKGKRKSPTDKTDKTHKAKKAKKSDSED
jgi:hypothetical protein